VRSRPCYRYVIFTADAPFAAARAPLPSWCDRHEISADAMRRLRVLPRDATPLRLDVSSRDAAFFLHYHHAQPISRAWFASQHMTPRHALMSNRAIFTGRVFGSGLPQSPRDA